MTPPSPKSSGGVLAPPVPEQPGGGPNQTVGLNDRTKKGAEEGQRWGRPGLQGPDLRRRQPPAVRQLRVGLELKQFADGGGLLLPRGGPSPPRGLKPPLRISRHPGVHTKTMLWV